MIFHLRWFLKAALLSAIKEYRRSATQAISAKSDRWSIYAKVICLPDRRHGEDHPRRATTILKGGVSDKGKSLDGPLLADFGPRMCHGDKHPVD